LHQRRKVPVPGGCGRLREAHAQGPCAVLQDPQERQVACGVRQEAEGET